MPLGALVSFHMRYGLPIFVVIFLGESLFLLFFLFAEVALETVTVRFFFLFCTFL